jgi:hypothetical protein
MTVGGEGLVALRRYAVARDAGGNYPFRSLFPLIVAKHNKLYTCRKTVS